VVSELGPEAPVVEEQGRPPVDMPEVTNADQTLSPEVGDPAAQSTQAFAGNTAEGEDDDASSDREEKRVGAQEEAADWRPSNYVTTTENERKTSQDDASVFSTTNSVVPHSMDSQPSRRSRDTARSRTPLRKLISSRQMEQLFGVTMPDHSDVIPAWSSRALSASPHASERSAVQTMSARTIDHGLPTPYSTRSSAPLTISSSRGGSSRGVFLALPDGADIGCVFVLRTSLHVRMGSELNSEDVCNLAAGTQVLLIERDELEDGTLRACVAKPPVGICHRTAMDLGLVTPLGWVSYVAKNGESNLILADDPAARAVLEARQKRKAAREAAKAATESARIVAQARIENRFLTREDSLPAIASARAMEAAGLLKPRPKPKPLVLKPAAQRVASLTIRSGQQAVPSRPHTLLGSGSASERMPARRRGEARTPVTPDPTTPDVAVRSRPVSAGYSRAKPARYAWPLRGF
jgi:hypothetical protein